jgi:hypothetical protein
MIYLFILFVFVAVAWKIVASPGQRRVGSEADDASARFVRSIAGGDDGRRDAGLGPIGGADAAGPLRAVLAPAAMDWPGGDAPPPAGRSAPGEANVALAAALVAARTAALTSAAEGRSSGPASAAVAASAGRHRRSSARLARFYRTVYGPGVCSPR